MAAMLGVAKAGAAYVSLDPFYPRQYLQHIINSAHPTLILMTSGEANWLKNDASAKDVVLDMHEPDIQSKLALCSDTRSLAQDNQVNSSV